MPLDLDPMVKEWVGTVLGGSRKRFHMAQFANPEPASHSGLFPGKGSQPRVSQFVRAGAQGSLGVFL